MHVLIYFINLTGLYFYATYNRVDAIHNKIHAGGELKKKNPVIVCCLLSNPQSHRLWILPAGAL